MHVQNASFWTNNKNTQTQKHKSRSYLFITATTACLRQATAVLTLLLLALDALTITALHGPHAKADSLHNEAHDADGVDGHKSDGILPAKRDEAHASISHVVHDVSEEVEEVVICEHDVKQLPNHSAVLYMKHAIFDLMHFDDVEWIELCEYCVWILQRGGTKATKRGTCA